MTNDPGLKAAIESAGGLPPSMRPVRAIVSLKCSDRLAL
jgi:hypothetical protein